MTMTVLNVYSGEQVGFGGTAKAHAYLLKDNKEVPLWVEAKKPQNNFAQISHEFIKAAPGFIDEFGKWNNTVYSVPEGSWISWHVSKTSRGGPITMGRCVVQMREGAAVRKVKFNLPLSENWALSMVHMYGNFDIVPYDEAVRAGLPLSTQWRRYYEPPVFDQAFEIEVMSPEATPRPVFRTSTLVREDGTEVNVNTRLRRRSLDI